MHRFAYRLAVLSAAFVSAIIVALSSVPATAADCYWSNGAYRCTDRSGRTYVVRPRAERQYRRSQEYARPRPYYVPEPGSGMGSFTYGCTISRCD